MILIGNTSKMLLASLLGCVLLSGCARVVVKNEIWCADAGTGGAECFYTLSDKEFSLDKYEWDRLRAGQILHGILRRGARRLLIGKRSS